jgi:hypothetical protein
MATIEKTVSNARTEKAASDQAEFEKYVTVKGLNAGQGGEWKSREDPTGRLVWRATGTKHEPLVIEVGRRIGGRNVTVTRITVP